MATVGEQKVKEAQAKKKKITLMQSSSYWKMLEEEGSKCLRDI